MRTPLRRRRASWLLWLLPGALVVALALAPASDASAVWTATGSGSAGAAAAVMPTGNAPTARATGTTVTIAWTAVTMVDGSAVEGYVINRYDASNGSPGTVGSACSGIVTTPTCTESSVPAGTWVYTDTPVEQNWTGGDTSDSDSVTTG